SRCLRALLIMLLFFFFFQAEDGIRDLYVTGVQTCALPILPRLAYWMSFWRAMTCWIVVGSVPAGCQRLTEKISESRRGRSSSTRSEERRVGKECRSRWAACGEKEKEGVESKTNAAEGLTEE